MSQSEGQDVARRIEVACLAVGLDLVHPFNLTEIDATEFGSLFDFARSNALGMVVGNTRNLWPIFIEAIASNRALATSEHPLNAYVTQRLTAIVAETTLRAAHIVFAHIASPRHFPIQQLADRVGLAALSPSHLSIHPKHGPWFALRAVIVVDVDGPGPAISQREQPCRDCSAPCLPALARAISVSGAPVTSALVAKHAADWIAVRDACPIGRDARYGDAQLRYHYAPSAAKLVQGL